MNYRFRSGDYVEIRGDPKVNAEYGKHGYITSNCYDGVAEVLVERITGRPDNYSAWIRSGWLNVIARKEQYGSTTTNTANTSKNMSLSSEFKDLNTVEPEKTFIKEGIIYSESMGSGNFTTDGEQLFLKWLLAKNGDDFKKEVVDPILAARAEAKK